MDLIPHRETLAIEFKSDKKTISESAIAENVVALANTDGGVLYVGVEDDGTVTGAQPAHRDPVRMAAMVANKTVPPVSVRATLLDAEMPVMALEVGRSKSIVATADGRMMRRRIKLDGQPESVPMYPYEISTRLSDLGRLDFTAQPVVDAQLGDFDPLERERLRNVIGTHGEGDKALLELSDDELDRALRLTVRRDGGDVPTLTGLLLIGRQESICRLAPTAGAVFQALQGTEVRANVEFKTPLVYTIERLVELVEPWNPVTEVASGVFSEPVPTFERRAVREAIVNAFGHRDYSVLGRVRVAVDDAGLTVASPGGFIEGIGPSNLLTAEPQGRNPCLMDALKRIGLAERTGRGIDRIYEGSARYGRPLPDYSGSTSTLVRLFIARNAVDEGYVRVLKEQERVAGGPLSLQALLVLDALRRKRRASMDELKGMLDVQPARLVQTLGRLVELGLIVAEEDGDECLYTLGEVLRAAMPAVAGAAASGSRARLRAGDWIMKLASENGRVTTAEVAEVLGASKPQAYYEISKLVSAGTLKKVQGGRGAYYAPVVAEDEVGA